MKPRKAHVQLRTLGSVFAALALLCAAPSATAQRSRGESQPQPTQEQIEQAARDRAASRRGGDQTVSPQAQAVGASGVPGLAARTASHSGVNVLQRIYLDPATGELAFVGRYDPTYATGAIDYSTLLSDALRSPAPGFSLEPTPASRAAMSRFATDFDRQMSANLSSTERGAAWLVGIFERLLTDPALSVDRQAFLARGAVLLDPRAAQAPEGIQLMLDRAGLRSVQPPQVTALVRTMLRPTDTPALQDFLTLFLASQGAYNSAGYIAARTPGEREWALGLMGLGPLVDSLRARVAAHQLNNTQGEALLEAAIWREIWRELNVPEVRWSAMVARAETSFNISEFRRQQAELNSNLFRERLMEPWLDGLLLSDAFLQRANGAPQIEVAPIYSGGLSANSELARVFLEADWSLKGLSEQTELARRVPGHRTPEAFLFDQENASGIVDNAARTRARFWLQPGTVPIRYASNRTVLQFGEAAMTVRAEVLEYAGGSQAGAAMTRNAMAAYGQAMTARYDQYARVLPELHRLREAAKILALVQWARANGVRLIPPDASAAASPLPDRLRRGFWNAYFLSSDGRTLMGLSASGGVDFESVPASTWVQQREDAALSSAASSQLSASAALGQAALRAAEAGDLDSARTLAEQSARAMTGNFDFTGHPALAQIPPVPPPTAVSQIALQAEISRVTSGSIDALAQARDPAQRATAVEQVRRLRTLYEQPPSDQNARMVVGLLRGGDWAGAQRTATAPAAAATTAAAPADPQALARERAAILGEITGLRQQLCTIQSHLRRFNATIQTNEEQRAEWERIVNDAYESALSRAKERVMSFATDFPDEILSERLAAAADPAERARLRRALDMTRHLQEAVTLQDFSVWASHQSMGREEVMEGISIIADVLEVEDSIKTYLSRRWGLARVIAFEEAASDLVTSAYDVTAEVVAWRGLSTINRNSEQFLQAVAALSQVQRGVMEQIHAREVRLGVPPGSTREVCP